MRWAFLLIVLLFFMACTNTTKIPDDIIPKAKMELVLWDLIQADRFSALFMFKDSTKINLDVENIKLYQRVFQIHKIKKEDFLKSYRFYMSRPDIGKIIFDSIAVKAERQRENIYKADSTTKVPATKVD